MIGTYNINNAQLTSFHPNDYEKEHCFGITVQGSGKLMVLSCNDAKVKAKWLNCLRPDTHFPNNELPVLTGYLLKQGAYLNLWKRRFFELFESDKELRYYTDKNRTERLGFIHLSSESAIVRYKPTAYDRDHAFGISHTINNAGHVLLSIISFLAY